MIPRVYILYDRRDEIRKQLTKCQNLNKYYNHLSVDFYMYCINF